MRNLSLTILILLLSGLPCAFAQKVVNAPLADGFDFPVGKPNGDKYYKARGFRPNGHLGEDWNGMGGGNTDLGDPVYSIGTGVVVFARDVRMGWGNVVIIRHAYLEKGKPHFIDSLYGHLDRIVAKEGTVVQRGQLIGTIGTNRGMYTAHLHFEIRKNLQIGINRSAFSRGFENYFDPTKFITPRRRLPKGGSRVAMPVNTFNHGKNYAPPSQGTAPSRSTRSRSSRSSRSNSFKVDRYNDLRR